MCGMSMSDMYKLVVIRTIDVQAPENDIYGAKDSVKASVSANSSTSSTKASKQGDI